MLFFAMIPKAGGGATPLGQRPLGVLPVAHRIWASARMVQLDDWFQSWVLDSVFSAGDGRGLGCVWWATEISTSLFSLRSGHPDFIFLINCRTKWERGRT